MMSTHSKEFDSFYQAETCGQPCRHIPDYYGNYCTVLHHLAWLFGDTVLDRTTPCKLSSSNVVENVVRKYLIGYHDFYHFSNHIFNHFCRWAGHKSSFRILTMDSDTSNDEEFSKCARQQRRNTDFSQADNDLKRFLEEREFKRIDSDGDLKKIDKQIAR